MGKVKLLKLADTARDAWVSEDNMIAILQNERGLYVALLNQEDAMVALYGSTGSLSHAVECAGRYSNVDYILEESHTK